MSTPSLPSYAETRRGAHESPAYTLEPQLCEQRLAHNRRSRARQPFEIVKQTKYGAISLRLHNQEGNNSLPEYGNVANINGDLLIHKGVGINEIDVRIEGLMQLREIAGTGTSTHRVCLDKKILWSKDHSSGSCPSTLSFSLKLPSKFSDGEKEYPLPPSYDQHLDRVPGFQANIDYAILVVINSKQNNPASLVPQLVKSAVALFGNPNSISIPFIFFPRNRPSVPLPLPLQVSAAHKGFAEAVGWKVFEDKMVSRVRECQDIIIKLYLPASRVFCMRQLIPFHITWASSAFSLAAFLPHAPAAGLLSNRRCTIELIRQSTVDVRNKTIMEVKTDIWRTDRIGRGIFRYAADGADWVSFDGEIVIDESVKLGGFKVSGLSVKDCIVLSIVHPDPSKSPYQELRQVIPVRLTTDHWSLNNDLEYFTPDDLETQPELRY